MSNIKFWEWDKKPRTMLRFVKPGDIFCFSLGDGKYYFGRIISKSIVGHIVEIFNFISEENKINQDIIESAHRLIPPFVLDSYLLFDKKYEKDADWRIIGHQSNYTPSGVDNIYFSYGLGDGCKKVDVFGNEFPITEKEASVLPPLSPHSSYHVRKLMEST
ncbi:phosphotriesterase [Mangrovibacter sp. MFB070]|uniref:immunity 26/phosphotriesterase HocA family protein n=1 Tax=Mangrovibacter sp. MFB070 TaxID=1224318 RepID=UPI0004D7F4FF|nr:immunity 26/phosphotriesterase HocA family protein [Mangrovibacter sp. MFB070]KEA50954.1 phosphotriesterase [Mangrovibacter sp. MFB070]